MGYFKTDCYRAFFSARFYGAVAVVMAVSLVSALGYFGGCVINGFHYMSWRSTYVLVYAAAAIPFAGVFVEDGLHKFSYPSIARGNLKGYAWSKILTGFFSAALTVGIGSLLFCCMVHIRMPWNTLDGETLARYENYCCFGFLLKRGMFRLYFFCYALMRGLLAGILAVLSQWLSLYVENRLFAIALPMSAYYFLVNYLPRPFNIYELFEASVNIAGTPFLKIPCAMLASASAVLVMGFFVERKLERNLRGRDHGRGGNTDG